MVDSQIPKACNLFSDSEVSAEKVLDSGATYSYDSFPPYGSGYEITANSQEVMWAGNERKQEWLEELYGKPLPTAKSGFVLSNSAKIVV